MDRNWVDDSFALAGKYDDVGLFYIEGAAVNATQNTLRRCGHLDLTTYDFVDEDQIILSTQFAVDSDYFSATIWT